MPLLTLNGDVTLDGASLRFGIVSATQSFLSPGIELAVSWRVHLLRSLTFDFNFLAQIRFSGGRTALNFRPGMGFSYLDGITSVLYADQYFIHANFGVSFLCLPLKNFYMEVGIDYSQLFISADYLGFFRPWISTGLQF